MTCVKTGYLIPQGIRLPDPEKERNLRTYLGRDCLAAAYLTEKLRKDHFDRLYCPRMPELDPQIAFGFDLVHVRTKAHLSWSSEELEVLRVFFLDSVTLFFEARANIKAVFGQILSMAPNCEDHIRDLELRLDWACYGMDLVSQVLYGEDKVAGSVARGTTEIHRCYIKDQEIRALLAKEPNLLTLLGEFRTHLPYTKPFMIVWAKVPELLLGLTLVDTYRTQITKFLLDASPYLVPLTRTETLDQRAHYFEKRFEACVAVANQEWKFAREGHSCSLIRAWAPQLYSDLHERMNRSILENLPGQGYKTRDRAQGPVLSINQYSTLSL